MVTIQTTDEGGNPITVVVPKSEAVGQQFPRAVNRKPPTGMERGALGFYNRMNEAIATMDAVEDQLTDRDIILINNSPLPELLNNKMLSAAGQQYAAAARTYTEARLRKESGAAIPPNEYVQDRLAVTRQSGDAPETIKQKRRVRQLTARGIANAAGPAYEEYYGEKLGPDTGGMVRMQAPDGMVKEVPLDQVEFYKSRGAKVVQ
jgi:hypothetical protein